MSHFFNFLSVSCHLYNVFSFLLLSLSRVNSMPDMSLVWFGFKSIQWHSLSIALHLFFFLWLSYNIRETKMHELTEIEIIHLPPKVESSTNTKVAKEPKRSFRKLRKIAKPQKTTIPTSTSTSKRSGKSLPGLNAPQLQSLKSIYIAKLRDQIETHKTYPRIAKKLRQSGKVVIMLEILKNGKILRKKIVEKCPYQRLNKAAFQLVAQLKHVDPLPKELHLDSWQVFIPIAYVLR